MSLSVSVGRLSISFVSPFVLLVVAVSLSFSAVIVISVYCVPTNFVVLACNPCTSCIFVVVRRYEH